MMGDAKPAFRAGGEADGDARTILAVMAAGASDRLIGALRELGWAPTKVTSLPAAHRMLGQQAFSVGLVVVDRVEETALKDIDAFLRRHGDVIWVGAFSRAALALNACRELILDHLFDHHTLPVDAERLSMTLGHAHGHAMMEQATVKTRVEAAEGAIVGQSRPIFELLRQLRRVAKVDAPVLICGESGSGKELAAQAIHRLSARSDGPFVAVNCGAIQPTLIQSALFGHVKGSFTGATRDERGLIEAASGGTIFLDEIGDLSPELQINLLRFLQESTITRVGSTRSVMVDVRVVAATHVLLEQAVASGTFRSDLFYRLNVLQVTVPPLRARRSDISLLAEHFFTLFSADKSPQLKGFSQRALRAMTDYGWPGNVRELINRVRRAMVMAEGRLIAPSDLGLDDETSNHSWDALDDARSEAERSAVQIALQHANGNVTEAAKQLRVSRMTLYRLMAKHSIEN